MAAAVNEFHVFWVEFDEDGFAAEFERDHSGGAAPAEGIEDCVAWFTPGEDADKEFEALALRAFVLERAGIPAGFVINEFLDEPQIRARLRLSA